MASPAYSLFTLVSDLKVFLLGGYQSFPITMAGTLILLGFMTANYAMLFFLVGLVIGVPIVTWLFNLVWGSLFTMFSLSDNSLVFPRASNVCDIISSATETSSTEKGPFASYWITMTMFFFGYLFGNAYTLYSLPPVYPSTDPEIKTKVDQQVMMRQSQTIIGLITIVLVAIIFLAMRIKSGCDAVVPAILATAGFGALGYSWYQILATTGKNTLSDLFGIANRLMSPDSLQNEPIGCIPQTN
jgi:hypothetical protein